MQSSLKKMIGIIQMCSSNNKLENQKFIEKHLKDASAQGVELCFLPECFNCISQNQEETLEKSEYLDGQSISVYKNLALSSNLWLSLGGFQEKQRESSKLLNTHILINNKGEIIESYNKIHLFDIQIDEKNSIRESNAFDYGQKLPPVIQTPIGKLGLSICYDLRFPELYRFLANNGAEILVVPSAFFKVTGEIVWHTLLKARAIENQCFVIAAAQSGKHNQKRESYGHSLVLDPQGKIILDMENEIGLQVFSIDLNQIQKTRAQVPAFFHQRFQFSEINLNSKPKY